MDYSLNGLELDELVASINFYTKSQNEYRPQCDHEYTEQHDLALDYVDVTRQSSLSPRLIPSANDQHLYANALSQHSAFSYDTVNVSSIHNADFMPVYRSLLFSAPPTSTGYHSRMPSTDTNSLSGPIASSSTQIEFLHSTSFAQESAPLGTMFVYPNDGSEAWALGGKLSIGYFDPKAQLRNIKLTVSQELAVLRNFQRGKLRKARPDEDFRHSAPHWKPVSLYVAAFTNVKPPIKLNAQYFLAVPYSSCFGRINMRIKRAWKRRQNKNRNSK